MTQIVIPSYVAIGYKESVRADQQPAGGLHIMTSLCTSKEQTVEMAEVIAERMDPQYKTAIFKEVLATGTEELFRPIHIVIECGSAEVNQQSTGDLHLVTPMFVIKRLAIRVAEASTNVHREDGCTHKFSIFQKVPDE